MTIIIETPRLILRTWKHDDVEGYFNINQDPKVIEFVRGNLSVEQINKFMDDQNVQQEKRNFAIWAAELKETGELLGFIGLNHVPWQAHFTPAVEVGWRLGSQYWGNGYAPEGAKAALEYGFRQCGLQEIIAFTVPANQRSIRVMEKIGLKRDMSGDFLHPELEPGHRLSQHILFKIGCKS